MIERESFRHKKTGNAKNVLIKDSACKLNDTFEKRKKAIL